MPGPMERVLTYFNKAQYEALSKYAKKHGLSLYALAKRAILEYVEKHP